MAPGMRVKIMTRWCYQYGKHGAPIEGVLLGFSPSGALARARMDDEADSFVWVKHLEPL
ncbi:MAG TPA: hypothetical protein VEK39_07255 [Solirubrobacterales bacterium]|nr:hypothetical protein [Solirubrobacterales bacterium]